MESTGCEARAFFLFTLFTGQGSKERVDVAR